MVVLLKIFQSERTNLIEGTDTLAEVLNRVTIKLPDGKPFTLKSLSFNIGSQSAMKVEFIQDQTGTITTQVIVC